MKPEAGVTLAKPAMVPVTRPTRLGLPKRSHSKPAQVRLAAAADKWVTTMAIAAPPSAASALPPLKPNQPTQSRLAPIIVKPGLCGGCRALGKPRRRPTITAMTRAETPAVACTTKPPAKSITPISASQPPPQIQWQTGA